MVLHEHELLTVLGNFTHSHGHITVYDEILLKILRVIGLNVFFRTVPTNKKVFLCGL